MRKTLPLEMPNDYHNSRGRVEYPGRIFKTVWLGN